MRINPLNNPHDITITPNRRSFSLLLSDMDFDNNRTTNIRYRLNGFDDGWNYPRGTQPSVTYNNLPPGKYELIIETEHNDGSWIETSDRIHINVTPIFTETAWFRLTLALLFAGLILILTLASVHYKRMRNAIQHKYSLLMAIDRLSEDLNAKAGSHHESVPIPADDDKRFIEASLTYLDDNISNPDLMVEDFARHLGMSRTAYYNRMKKVFGVSPVDFIRQMRIKRALKHLESDEYNISEVAYMVGFSDPKYFSRCFKAEMAMTPSQYAAQAKLKGQAEKCGTNGLSS